MSLSEKSKRLRKWFQRHKWHTSNTPTGSGFFLESPVMSCAGIMHTEKNTGKEFNWEHCIAIELDRFNCAYLTFRIFSRKHYWKRDLRVPNNGFWYSTVPSDEFSEWKNDAVYMNIPAIDILKLAEMIKASQNDMVAKRPEKNHHGFMERAIKKCGIRWLGRNSSYEEIKKTYSNDRLMKERETNDPFMWQPESSH